MKLLFFNLLQEGGAFFMYSLLLLLFICIGLLIKAFTKGDPDGKIQKLISSISLFALVFGFFGHLIGLISALDTLSINTDIAYEVLARGIKIGLLPPTFGLLIFLIVRVGIISLIAKKK